jgi:hypothetical protein
MEHLVSTPRAAAHGLRRMVTALVLASATLVPAACGGPGGSSPPASTAGPATGAAGIPADFPLLGAWSTEITKADLAAAGLSDPAGQNENSGRFTWTFAADGTWTLVQESLDGSPINTPIFRGTYTVDGQSLVAVTLFPEQYRDDGLTYGWVLEDGGVRFDLVDPPDAVLPLIVETHPWTRAG